METLKTTPAEVETAKKILEGERILSANPEIDEFLNANPEIKKEFDEVLRKGGNPYRWFRSVRKAYKRKHGTSLTARLKAAQRMRSLGRENPTGSIIKENEKAMQVCVPCMWTNQQILEHFKQPHGEIAKDGHEQLNGDSARVDCKTDKKNVHVIILKK